MPQLLCHLIGDYVLQNHWMARNKIRGWVAAIIHVVFYSIPFLFLGPSPTALAVIAGTHLLIDRFQLAKYWVDFWGVGNTGSLWLHIDFLCQPSDPPFSPTMRERDVAPVWLATWLKIIVDNTFHLVINYLALTYL